jgi:hypothetical protein
MKTLTAALATILAAVFVMFVTPAVAASDVTGSWKVAGDVAGHVIDATMTLKQEGDALSGTVEFVGRAKPAPLTGTVEDAMVTMTFTVQADEGTYEQTWTGTLGADGVLKGTIDVQQGLATGEFTATKL